MAQRPTALALALGLMACATVACTGDDDATTATTVTTTVAPTTVTSVSSTAPTTVTATTTAPTTVSAPAPETTTTLARPAPETTAAPAAPETTAAPAPPPTEPPPQPEGPEPPCTAEALDAAAGPAQPHRWDDLVCVGGYAHAYLVFEDITADSPEFVFLAGDGGWRTLARGTELDGSAELAGLPPEVLEAFQLLGPTVGEPDAPSDTFCDATILADATTSAPAGTSLSEVRCAGPYARAAADLGGGARIDIVYAAGPAGWRELASAPDLTANPALFAIPPEFRARLGF